MVTSPRNLIRLTAVYTVLLMCPPALADDALWQRIQQEDNIVLLMRHSYVGPGNGTVWDKSGKCQGERLISSEGKLHAQRIGKQFASRQLQPQVLSSPLCRAKDTAKIAFGESKLVPPLRPVRNASDEEVAQQTTRQLLLDMRGKQPVVMVSHQPTIDALTLELISIGDVVVGKVTDDGEIDVIGQLKIK